MHRTCLKCGAENTESNGAITEACPACGAIYSKVENAAALPRTPTAAEMLAKRQAAEHAKEMAERAKEVSARVKRDAAQEAWNKQEAERDARAVESHKAIRENAALASFVCLHCGSVGRPKRATPGNGGIETALWLGGFGLFITLHWLYMIACFVAAMGYSLWRAFSKFNVCRKCKSKDIIPADSPKGREALTAAGLIAAQ